jgi:hypothetical protein
MPKLRNIRHEAFAQELFKGLGMNGRYETSASAAYTRSGGTTHKPSAKVIACNLLKAAPQIVERVKELQGELAEASKTSLEKVVERLDLASHLAEEIKQPSGITAAELGKAKLLGLEPPERQEIGAPGSFGSISAATTHREFVAAYLKAHMGIDATNLPDEKVREAASIIMEGYKSLAALAPDQLDEQTLTKINHDSGASRRH